jgi:NAD+ diphosphatase
MNSMFQFCPKCGEKGLLSPEDKLIKCGCCDFQFYRNPAVATAAIIADPSGKLLLIRRAKEPSKGKLGMPGGFTDIGETAEDGLRREVKEETSLELRDIKFLMSWPNRYVYAGILYPTVDFFFTARVESFAPAQALSEVDELVIRDPRKVEPEELAFDSMRRALRRYTEAI